MEIARWEVVLFLQWLKYSEAVSSLFGILMVKCEAQKHSNEIINSWVVAPKSLRCKMQVFTFSILNKRMQPTSSGIFIVLFQVESNPVLISLCYLQHGQLALRWKSLKKYKVSTSWLKNVSILKSPSGEKSIWSYFITETWCWNQGEITNNLCTVLRGNVIFFSLAG